MAAAILAGGGISAYVIYYFEPDKGHAEAEIRDIREKEAVDILASERVAYYTEVLTIFTGVLATFGVIQLIFLMRTDAGLAAQIRLGREEFEATHRPWIAIRKVALRVPAIHVSVVDIDVQIDYWLENTSNVPAVDVSLYGNILLRKHETHVDEIVKANINKYLNDDRAGIIKSQQTMIIFPNETQKYTGSFNWQWRNLSANTEATAQDLSDLLAVAVFIYHDPARRTAFKYSACVHQIRTVIPTEEIEAAKAGTGIMKDGRISRWRLGWGAT